MYSTSFLRQSSEITTTILPTIIHKSTYRLNFTYLKLLVFIGLLLPQCHYLKAQVVEKGKGAKVQYSNGIGIVAPDSLFSLNFRFRIQNRAAYTTVSDDSFSASTIEAMVRRLRMRFEGFILHPKINYFIQLSFTRADMDWNVNDNSTANSSPNVVRDAVLIYKPTQHWTMVFGQTKLPGNRQRVVSSGDLQFSDRSIANATFNLDRDFGLHAYYQNNLSNFVYILKGVISSGEGRNSVSSDAGLAYTGRLELLPFGTFTNKGDYYEGDLAREQTPKLAIAGGYHRNEGAIRTAGTLGRDLYSSRNLEEFIADMVFKYKGFAFTAEYITRHTGNPITENALGQQRVVYIGRGTMGQMSYLFKNNYEIAGRFASVTPSKSIYAVELYKEEIGIGVTKYLRQHRLKVQGNLFYLRDKDMLTSSYQNERWMAVFQVELGF